MKVGQTGKQQDTSEALPIESLRYIVVIKYDELNPFFKLATLAIRKSEAAPEEARRKLSKAIDSIKVLSVAAAHYNYHTYSGTKFIGYQMFKSGFIGT